MSTGHFSIVKTKSGLKFRVYSHSLVNRYDIWLKDLLKEWPEAIFQDVGFDVRATVDGLVGMFADSGSDTWILQR